MNILLISPLPPPPGGDSTWTLFYLNWISNHNSSVRVVNSALMGNRAKNAGSNVSILGEVNRTFRIWFGILKNILPIDIVHMNTNCSPRGIIRDLISAIIIKFFFKPIILHCHCNIQDQLGTNTFIINAFKYLGCLSEKIIVLNDFSKKFADKYFGSKVAIIPNFISEDLVIERKPINNSISRIIFVGHVKRTKGICEIIKVANELSDITFVVIGPLSENFSKELIPDNINFLGSMSQQDVFLELDKSDVYLFPSHTEGFSVSMLEAMSRGLPIIATDVGANRDMIEEGGGHIVGIKSVEEIIESIKKIGKKSVRMNMSQFNIYKVRQYYTIPLVMKKYINTYNDVLNNNKKT